MTSHPRRKVRDELPCGVPPERTDQAPVPFVAVLLELHKQRSSGSVEWAFFQGREQIEGGSFDTTRSSIEGAATDLISVLERTKEGDGYLVSYGGDLLLRLESALLSVQSPLRLCDLSQPLIQRLVDNDLCKTLTLKELYLEQRSKTTSVDKKEGNKNADGRKLVPRIDMVGSCFHWFSSRYDGELLTMRKTNPLSTQPLPSWPLMKKLSFGRAPRADRSWDSIDDSTERAAVDLENLKFVAFDVETHGWTEGITHIARSNWIGRVVEIGWFAFDAEYNELIKNCYLLKPHGYQYIQQRAVDYHGITTRCAVENGSESCRVFDEFCQILQHIPEDGFVIAHNMNHEDGVMGTNLEGSNLEIWNRTPKCCTMNPSAFPELMSGNGIDATRRRFIKLGDIHKMLYPEESRFRLEAHNSLGHALMAWDVFQYVVETDQLPRIVWTPSPPLTATNPFGKRPRNTY